MTIYNLKLIEFDDRFRLIAKDDRSETRTLDCHKDTPDALESLFLEMARHVKYHMEDKCQT